MPITFSQLLTVGDKYGFAAVCVVALAAALWIVVWHMVKNMVPRELYDKALVAEQTSLTDAIKANTNSIEILNIKIDERLPRNAGK